MGEHAAPERLAFARRLAADLAALHSAGSAWAGSDSAGLGPAGLGPAATDTAGPWHGWLAGCYLHGSAVLGGWNAGRSDVDVLVLARSWSADLHGQVAEVLAGAARQVPGTGLELSVVAAEAARVPQSPWPFLLHAAGHGADLRLVDGTTHPGDPDLALHYAVARAQGLAVHGPAPGEVIGEVARDDVLAQLAAELDWALAHAHEAYLVLNALRAEAYVTTGAWLSETAAGERAADQPLVARALAVQRGEEEPGPPGDEARALARRARAAIPWHLARPPREHGA